MKAKFWGVRGSIPTPIGSEEIYEKIVEVLLLALAEGVRPENEEQIRAYVSDLPHLKRGTIGGNTACVEVRSGSACADREESLILDAGSGLRLLGREMMKGTFGRGEGTAHLFISHTHWDHIMGFPFFAPAFVPGNRIFMYGVHENMEERMKRQQMSEHFPIPLEKMGADIAFVRIEEGETVHVGPMSVRSMELNHPGRSFAYRIEEDGASLIYATDVEFKDISNAPVMERYYDFFRNGDALIFDAQYTLPESWGKEDWGHSSAFIGVDIATTVGIKKLILFHHEPTYSDDKIESEVLSESRGYLARFHSDAPLMEVIAAYEGLELAL